MIGGQAADVSGSARDLASLEEMYRKKTGALLAAALMSGAAVGGTDDLTLKRLEIYAYDIGVAYQFRDDVLDVTSTRDELGKDIGSDSDEGKVTAVTLLGVDGANNKAKEYFEDALDAVAPLGERSKPLFELADLLGRELFDKISSRKRLIFAEIFFLTARFARCKTFISVCNMRLFSPLLLIFATIESII